MPHAKFDHQAHGGFTCVSCHEKALRSSDSGDLLLPGIKTCQTCHAHGPEHAESRCFECHTYHDWSKRKEITPIFSFPLLKTGGL
jgi:ribosomal protein L40E